MLLFELSIEFLTSKIYHSSACLITDINWFISDPSIGIIEPIVGPDIIGFNPYPSLGAPSRPCWPRGLPLHMINDNVTNKWSRVNDTIKFGVLPSMADIQPDVDAIYRLTKDTPFNFNRPESIPSPVEQRGK